MFLFGKKSMNSEEYEKLAKRITDLESELNKFIVKFMSLRGLVHRKKFDDVEEESQQEIKQENIKGNVLLPDSKGINSI